MDISRSSCIDFKFQVTTKNSFKTSFQRISYCFLSSYSPIWSFAQGAAKRDCLSSCCIQILGTELLQNSGFQGKTGLNYTRDEEVITRRQFCLILKYYNGIFLFCILNLILIHLFFWTDILNMMLAKKCKKTGHTVATNKQLSSEMSVARFCVALPTEIISEAICYGT